MSAYAPLPMTDIATTTQQPFAFVCVLLIAGGNRRD